MFDIGASELVIIFILVLLIYGPERMPDLAKRMGRASRDIKHAMDEVKGEFTRETRTWTEPDAPPPVAPPKKDQETT